MTDEIAVPKQVSAFRRGDIIILSEEPCKVLEMATSKTGKHGGAKVHLTTLHVFTGKKVEQIASSTDKLPSADLHKVVYLLNHLEDPQFPCLYNEESSEFREDIKLSMDMQQKIEAAFENLKSDEEIRVDVHRVLQKEEVVDFSVQKKPH